MVTLFITHVFNWRKITQNYPISRGNSNFFFGKMMRIGGKSAKGGRDSDVLSI
jgi:hypothetical protein